MTVLSSRWQEFYIRLALEVASGSKDASTKCGAILVRPDKTVASIGFNGFPKRLVDNQEFLTNPVFREDKLSRMTHAEQNCLNYNRDYDTAGFHMFISAHPCDKCALRIISTNISYIYYAPNPAFEARWAEPIARAKVLLEEAGITLIEVTL